MLKKILVVDDEIPILRLLEINFSRAGYEVITALDGAEGLDKLNAEKPDIVVLDIIMPVMDGYEMLTQMRSDPRWSDIPVVILTAKAQDADSYESLRSGATTFITKPVVVSDLITLVKRVLALADAGIKPTRETIRNL
jgi:two-component system, OmpR family, alkaline phosphatase synthesis response regulator PhoP